MAEKKRIAVYMRVGISDTLTQRYIELETKHSEARIRCHKGWEYVGAYVDTGSGTWDISGRPELARLLDDCRAGKVDIILTKSVSRLHRNVVECLTIVKELLELSPPVGIIFEQEGLNTLDERTPLMIQIMTNLAALESECKHVFSSPFYSVRGYCNYLQHRNEEATDNV
jgi:DNA invertase Pin-like site-specific DNA recombinase